MYFVFFFELYAFIILTSTLVLGIVCFYYTGTNVLTSNLVLDMKYFVIITRPLHPKQVRKRSTRTRTSTCTRM